MATDPSMGFEYPDVNGDGDAWGQLLNDALETIGAHSHVPGQGEPVKSAGLRIDQDVQWNYNGSFFALLQARALGLRPQPAASVVGDLNVFYVDSANNNLWFRNQNGIPVRLTNGNQIDITLVGGIVGDYAAVGAEVAFEDANDTYTFKQQGSPRPWAKMRCGDLDLYQAAASIINRVRLRSPNALAASYEVVFPGALPGVPQIVQIDAAGQLSFSNTVTQDLKHGDRVLSIPALFCRIGTGWAIDTGGIGGSSRGYLASSAAGTFYLPVSLREGDRLKSITFARFGDGAADLTVTGLSVAPDGSLTVGTIGSLTVTNPPASWGDSTIDLVDTTITGGVTYWLEFTGNAANLRVGSIRLTYDHP